MGETRRDPRKCQGRLSSYPQDGQLGYNVFPDPIALCMLSDFSVLLVSLLLMLLYARDLAD